MLALLLVLALTYSGLALVLYLFQERLLYFPGRAIEATPAAAGLAFEEVWFSAADGVHLHGWLVPAAHRRGTLLFCHGNAGNISHRLDSLRIFHELGYQVFVFDYRGYGRSQGHPDEQGTYADAEGAWRFLVKERNLAPAELVFFGRSLGGAVAARLAVRHPGRALILESTPTSIPDLAARFYPLLPVRLLCRYRYDTLAAVRRLSTPLLIVHSPEDEIIPFTHAERLLAATRAPKQLLRIQGDHNSGFLASGPRYQQGLAEFLHGLAKK